MPVKTTISACWVLSPNPESEVLNLFANRYIINKQTKRLQVVKPKVDPIAQKLSERLAKEAV